MHAKEPHDTTRFSVVVLQFQPNARQGATHDTTRFSVVVLQFQPNARQG